MAENGQPNGWLQELIKTLKDGQAETREEIQGTRSDIKEMREQNSREHSETGEKLATLSERLNGHIKGTDTWRKEHKSLHRGENKRVRWAVGGLIALAVVVAVWVFDGAQAAQGLLSRWMGRL